MVRFVRTFCLFTFCLGFAASVAAADKGFPGRDDYPDIPTIETQELRANLNDVVLVDTRSSYEFNTLRMLNSVNIPVAAKDFEEQMTALRDKTDKTIVFYCNGRTCYKSYLAVKKSEKAGVKNTMAFDAGVFEWTVAYPDKAELLGSKPVNASQLISDKKLRAHMLDPTTFSDRIFENETQSLVLDVRDKYQREGVGCYPGKERWASLDDMEKVQSFIDRAKRENKTLYIYDEVGKQVPWLQYALEAAGVKKYYFMDKGAKGYFAMLNIH